jgi:hypothetical protein
MPGDRSVAAFRAAPAAGARGCLAGRAVWCEAVQAYPDMMPIRQALEPEGVRVLRALNQALAEVPPVTTEADWRLPVAARGQLSAGTPAPGGEVLPITEQATDHGAPAPPGYHA